MMTFKSLEVRESFHRYKCFFFFLNFIKLIVLGRNM